MAVNEEIVTGRKFRKLIDETTNKWLRLSIWSKASDTEFNDGKDAETKVGAIDGITDSLASTSSRIAASAKAVNTLSNDLAQKLPNDVKIITEGSGKDVKYYAQMGADAVTKKLLGSAELLWTNPSVQSQATIVATCDWSKYDKIIILACYYYGLTTSRYIQCCDIGFSTTGWSINSSNGTTRKVTFNNGNITMNVTDTAHNWESYNIPLKIWGVCTETDMFTYP